jgi:endonuclease G
MNAERRLAYVSAGNHDPLAPFKPARDKEPWSLDPRILENEQIGNELYKFNDLDRGHLLRRVDGSWGSSEKAALRADHDTYFWTNISPQHERLNQSKLQGIWGLLENSVTEQATATSTRYSVFNGPIFGDKDRTHRGIRIPSGFFKLVAFVDNGTLAALAFRLGQEELLVNLPLEKIEPNEFGVFQLPVSDLGDLVHLDFGPLVAADRFVKRQAGNESMVPGHRQKPIGGAGDIVV